MIVTLPDRQLLEALTSHTPADRLGVELEQREGILASGR